MLSQERIIEKRGLLILTPEEKKALDLQVHVAIKQIPLKTQSWNYRIYPNRSWFGWACLMIGASVFKDIELQFLNQCIYHYSRAVEQGAGTDMNNFDTILSALVTLSAQITPPGILAKLPTIPIVYGLCPLDVVHFELPQGVVLKVQTHIIPFADSASIFIDEQDNSVPGDEDNGVQSPPLQEPPPGSPPNTKGWLDLISDAPFTISPPYDGFDDNGRTYAPPFVPPWLGEDGQDPNKVYKVNVRISNFNPNGTSQGTPEFREIQGVPGKITGLGSSDLNNPNSPYGIKSNGSVASGASLGPTYEFPNNPSLPYFTSYRKAQIISVQSQ